MKKIPENAPCPCGSGRKYKHCCMNKGKVTGPQIPIAPVSAFPVRHIPLLDDIDQLHNSVLDLIDDNRLDEAEKVCMRLLAEYPTDIDGLETSVLVYRARKDYRQAAAYAIETVAFMRKQKAAFASETIREFEGQAKELMRLSAECTPD